MALASRVQFEYYRWPGNSILRYIPHECPDIFTRMFTATFFLEKTRNTPNIP